MKFGSFVADIYS